MADGVNWPLNMSTKKLHPLATDIEAYATLRAQLASDADQRDELLAQHDLDEELWDALDEQWQDKLSDQLETGATIPDLIIRYNQAFTDAQRDGPGQPLSLERFAEATRALQNTLEPQKALEKLGIALPEFLKANQVWAPRLASDPAMAKRFTELLAQ